LNDHAKKALLTGGLIGLWALLVGMGYLALIAYHATPGPIGTPPTDWPRSSLVALSRGRPTLLFFIHPRCPCSRASVAELARVATRCRDKVSVQVVSYTPETPTVEWDRIAREAQTSIPGSGQILDRGGREAERFGVKTSGHALLFGSTGHRLFSGGITASRGHEGPNPGVDRLVEAIMSQADEPRMSPVFGCPFQADRSPILNEAER
jgi:hypothetical protein